MCLCNQEAVKTRLAYRGWAFAFSSAVLPEEHHSVGVRSLSINGADRSKRAYSHRNYKQWHWKRTWNSRQVAEEFLETPMNLSGRTTMHHSSSFKLRYWALWFAITVHALCHTSILWRIIGPWTGKSCFSNRALVKAIFEALRCLKK